MSVDYDGVGGVGLRVTDAIVEKLIEHGLFTEADYEKDVSSCLEKIKLPYSVYGNAYSGDIDYALFVKGTKLSEIYENAPKFIARLEELGISMEADDLEVICEGYLS